MHFLENLDSKTITIKEVWKVLGRSQSRRRGNKSHKFLIAVHSKVTEIVYSLYQDEP